VGERVAEDPPLAGQQRVDVQQMGHGRGRRGHQAEPAAERQEPQLEGQE
jgi:hypothetical protein